jgi:flavin reductase (DIM6/NTAB) family NADH-FMN oxidoreductase RutF
MKKSLSARTILYPTPVVVIGSYDSKGKPNVMTSSWVGICCSQPPCLMVALRKETYSYGNLMERKAYTVNLPTEKQLEIADCFGMASGKNEDKLKKTGLTAVRSTLVDAPYIEEFPLVLECKVVQTINLGLHTQFIGEVLDVKIDENYLDSHGLPSVPKLKPFSFAPESRIYYALGAEIGKTFEAGKKFKS